MRNDRALIPVLHVAHKCSYFHQHLSDNFILLQKCQHLGCMSLKIEGSGSGFNRKRGLAETDS